MFCSENTDYNRQEDEIMAISSIYNSHEFTCNRTDQIECLFNIFLSIGDKDFLVYYVKNNTPVTPSSIKSFSIECLPPIRLYVQLPTTYPSKSPPNFKLIISWLPPWQISFICQKLDEIWEENNGSEILFLWLNFLKNDLLAYINIDKSLDVTFMHMVFEDPITYLNSNLFTICDKRAINKALALSPEAYLTKYSNDQRKIEFNKKFYTCGICFEELIGSKCTEISKCCHIFCSLCMKQYIESKITSRIFKILCPSPDCTTVIEASLIKELCPGQYEQYDTLILHFVLRTMDDIIFCPRKQCQSPVLKETDGDTLATCVKCNYNFCIFCLKVYHGVAPCVMTSNENMKLINDYEKGSFHEKNQLVKKYGRKQIQELVEKHLSNKFLKETAKSCPKCHTFITKTDGCNKIICIYCQTPFCWLCGNEITTKDAYEHFTKYGSSCYDKLFEGMVDELPDEEFEIPAQELFEHEFINDEWFF
ncbi:E3 ubiquitin-protein ligase RNF14-like [Prorops nasuta]|uniref:E3 ubiquitin-protein ligase RNF14-like n=1 Tax=Prorops nasuta TaxID=863751 RepID=UPI0034CE2334